MENLSERVNLFCWCEYYIFVFSRINMFLISGNVGFEVLDGSKLTHEAIIITNWTQFKSIFKKI